MGHPFALALVCLLLVLLGSAVIDAFTTNPSIFTAQRHRCHGSIELHNNKDDKNENQSSVGPNMKRTQSSVGPVMTIAKWKKKRYLMMNDVQRLIEKRDRGAPHKAQEVIQRMRKLSQVYRDERLLPTERVYNVCGLGARYVLVSF